MDQPLTPVLECVVSQKATLKLSVVVCFPSPLVPGSHKTVLLFYFSLYESPCIAQASFKLTVLLTTWITAVHPHTQLTNLLSISRLAICGYATNGVGAPLCSMLLRSVHVWCVPRTCSFYCCVVFHCMTIPFCLHIHQLGDI